MALTLHAAIGAVVALLFWTVLGLCISQRIFPSALRLPVAPALGWAVHSAVALPIFMVLGFSALGVAALAAIAATPAVAASKLRFDDQSRHQRIPSWAYLVAAVLALAPALAVAPEHVGDAVVVAKPIYDHAKIAIIDAMTRLGLAPRTRSSASSASAAALPTTTSGTSAPPSLPLCCD